MVFQSVKSNNTTSTLRITVRIVWVKVKLVVESNGQRKQILNTCSELYKYMYQVSLLLFNRTIKVQPTFSHSLSMHLFIRSIRQSLWNALWNIKRCLYRISIHTHIYTQTDVNRCNTKTTCKTWCQTFRFCGQKSSNNTLMKILYRDLHWIWR